MIALSNESVCLMNDITSPKHRFSHSSDTLQQIAQDMLAYARQQGATASTAEVSDGFGQTSRSVRAKQRPLNIIVTKALVLQFI